MSRAAPLPPTERRAAIVTATAPLLAELGEHVTTKQLAEAAGVSEGTIFNVFDDKSDLVDAVIEATLDPARMELALSRIDSSNAFEARLVEATAIVQRRMIEIWKLFAALGPRTHRRPHPLPDSPGLIAIFESDPTRVRIPPVDAARRLRGLVFAMSHPFITPKPASAAEIVEMFLHGAATPRRGGRR